MDQKTLRKGRAHALTRVPAAPRVGTLLGVDPT